MDKSKIYLDLSKCTEEEQKHAMKLVNFKMGYDNTVPYLMFFEKRIVGFSDVTMGKTELTYPEFIKLFEGGEGETSLQISPNLKEKVKFHLKMSVKAWHDWDEDLPNQVEVICNEVKRNRGQFLNVKRWLIIPPKSGLKECLVAEIDNGVQIHINHLVPAVF